MRFRHDPTSGALYLRLREGEIAETLELPTPGAYVDIDEAGNVMGLEFLSLQEFFARERDPGLPVETARELAVYAWDHLREMGTPDAPELARRLLADHSVAGATAANVVALSAVTYCAEH